MIFSSIFTGLFMTVGFTALIYNYVLMGGNSGLFFLVWGGGFSLAGLYFHSGSMKLFKNEKMTGFICGLLGSTAKKCV